MLRGYPANRVYSFFFTRFRRNAPGGGMRASASLLRMPQYRRPPATQFRTRSLVQRRHYISCDAGIALICRTAGPGMRGHLLCSAFAASLGSNALQTYGGYCCADFSARSTEWWPRCCESCRHASTCANCGTVFVVSRDMTRDLLTVKEQSIAESGTFRALCKRAAVP